jgi:hypothetical protein
MTKRNPVPFRWAALTLSALVIPAPIGLLTAIGSLHPVYAFVLFTGVGYVFTLAIIAVLLLPALWILSWVAPIKGWLTTLLGGLIAFPLFVGWDYISWHASGVDSGPPDCTYAQWIAKNWFSWEPLSIVGFGMVSAAAYHFLATRKSRPVTPGA